MRLVKTTFKTLRHFMKKTATDHVSSFSAHAAFFIMTSMFPFLMFLFMMIKYLPFDKELVITSVEQFFPETLSPILINIIHELFLEVPGSILSITILTTLWTASRGFYAIVRGLNAVYGLKENRNFFYLSLLSVIYTVIFACMLIVTMVLLVFGNQILNLLSAHIPQIGAFSLLISILRLLLPLLVLTVFFLALFMVIPNRRSRLKYELPGALFAAVCWMGFSALFSYYIDHYANYAKTYGSLAAIVIFMLWLYFCMYLMFLGAEFNVFLLAKKRQFATISDRQKPL